MGKLFENRVLVDKMIFFILLLSKHCLSFNSRSLFPAMMNGQDLAEHLQKLMQIELMQRRRQLLESLPSPEQWTVCILSRCGKDD